MTPRWTSRVPTGRLHPDLGGVVQRTAGGRRPAAVGRRSSAEPSAAAEPATAGEATAAAENPPPPAEQAGPDAGAHPTVEGDLGDIDLVPHRQPAGHLGVTAGGRPDADVRVTFLPSESRVTVVALPLYLMAVVGTTTTSWSSSVMIDTVADRAAVETGRAAGHVDDHREGRDARGGGGQQADRARPSRRPGPSTRRR